MKLPQPWEWRLITIYGAFESGFKRSLWASHFWWTTQSVIATILASICSWDNHDSLPIDNPTLSAVRQVSSDSITNMSFLAPTLLHLLLRKLLHQLQNCAPARPQFTFSTMSVSIDFCAYSFFPHAKVLFYSINQWQWEQERGRWKCRQ